MTIDQHQLNRNVIAYRVHAANYLLTAKAADPKLNATRAEEDYHWACDTFDYLVLHSTGLGPFEDATRDAIERLGRRIWDIIGTDGVQNLLPKV